MSEQVVENQHQAPRVYLGNFTDKPGKTGRVWVFDKETQRATARSPKSAASSRYFYDLPEDEAAHPNRVQRVEKALGTEEAEFAELNKRLLVSLEDLALTSTWNLRPAITAEQREALARWISLQALRTQEFRAFQQAAARSHIDSVKDILDDYRRGMSKKLRLDDPSKIKFTIRQGDEEYAEEDYTNYDPNLASTHQAKSMFGNVGKNLASILEEHIWIFGVNDTAHSLYTSDSPVVKHPHKHKYFPTSGGFDSEGIEVLFPISPRFLLMMRERTYHAQMQAIEDQLYPLAEENVTFYNRLQVIQSYNQVVCRDDDFDEARDVCERIPEVRMRDKRRIGSTRPAPPSPS